MKQITIPIVRTTEYIKYIDDLFTNRMYYNVLGFEDIDIEDFPTNTPQQQYVFEDVTCQLIRKDDKYYIYTMAKGKPEEVGYVSARDLPFYNQFGKIRTRCGKMFRVVYGKNDKLKIEEMFEPYHLQLILEENKA